MELTPNLSNLYEPFHKLVLEKDIHIILLILVITVMHATLVVSSLYPSWSFSLLKLYNLQ